MLLRQIRSLLYYEKLSIWANFKIYENGTI